MMTKKTLLLTPLIFSLTASLMYAEPEAAEPSQVVENAAGKAAFATCAACHGADGKGVAIGDKMMAAPLAGSKIVNGKPEVMALAVLKGIKQEGANYMVPMAPLEAAFKDDAKFAAVLTYVRQSFGNTGTAVTAEEVATFRAQWKDQSEPVTREHLTELNAK